MKEHHYNYIWIGIIAISIISMFILIKTAYANPLNLPDYAFKKPVIREGYEFAKLNMEKLEGLPCNCGCMEDAAAHGGRLHSRGLLDCFMQGDINNNGKWDSHASDCGLCVEDAILAKQMYEEGKSKEEIAKLLKDKYSKQKISEDTVYGK